MKLYNADGFAVRKSAAPVLGSSSPRLTGNLLHEGRIVLVKSGLLLLLESLVFLAVNRHPGMIRYSQVTVIGQKAVQET